MKKRVVLCGIVSLALLTLLTYLSAELGEPFQLNQETGESFFAGQNGFRRVGETIYAVYLERDEENISIVYAHTNEPFQEINYLEIDNYESSVVLGEPALVVMADGSVIIVYPKRIQDEEEFLSSLFIAEVSSEGQTVDISVLSENRYSQPHAANMNDDLLVLSATGLTQPSLTRSLFFDQYVGLDGVAGNIRFFGQDAIYGSLHANTDIWIRQTGGGDNDGWPIFHGLVTTSGEIMVYPGGTYPEDQIFLGGLIENYPEMTGPLTAELVRMNGIRPFGSTENDNRIAFVTVNGSYYESWIGNIQEGPVEEFSIYDSYPPYGPIGEVIGVNQIAVRDTAWTPGPSGQIPSGASVFVPYELWISGEIAGRQTWASSHNIYIKDNITYANTVPGQPPDGGLDGAYPVNTTDALALVSERSILVQYGYRHPEDQLRYKPNTEDIYIYGYLIAAGEDEPNPFDAGIFSFQYQHPKGSTPSQIWQGDFYENIDLHLRHYPTTAFNPWPPGLDYPWYNPLWPEPGSIFDPGAPYSSPIPNPHDAPTISYLRGTINLFGGIASRKAGFVRRSGNPDYDTGIWDQENHLFGRHAGQPVGYDKNYHYDTRLPYISPPDISASLFNDSVQEPSLLQCLIRESDGIEFQSLFEVEDIAPQLLDNLQLSVFNQRVAIAANNKLFLSDENGNNFQSINLPSYESMMLDMVLLDDCLYYIENARFLSKYDLITGSFTVIDERILPNRQQALAYDGGNLIWAAAVVNPDQDGGSIELYIYDQDGEVSGTYSWDYNYPAPVNYCAVNSKLGIQAENCQITLMVHNRSGEFHNNSGDVFFATGTFDYSAVDKLVISPPITLSHYPNPVYFSGERATANIKICFALPEASQVNISLYNIKGQLVKSIFNERLPKGDYEISWDGKDNRGRRVAKGNYLYRLDTGNHSVVRKMLIME